MTEKQKKGIIISAVSFPVAYILGVLLFHITQLINIWIPGIISIITLQDTILPIVIVLNMIAAVIVWGNRE